jgi:hypothetical protein
MSYQNSKREFDSDVGTVYGTNKKCAFVKKMVMDIDQTYLCAVIQKVNAET